ncbi:MAG: NADH dehydrogenase [ubiquinone] 1 alpha subcomplex assembly factor 1 [Myxococcota bacterium]|jgi:NADH dehydrogenase [ubiquinone] 1 alpha subcomplex assembly factor 1
MRSSTRRLITAALGLAFVACSTSSAPPRTVPEPSNETPKKEAMTKLFDFAKPADVRAFGAMDDRVMGGISQSQLAASSDATAYFTGNLSLERNGGFASVRASDLAFDLLRYDGITIRVRGDGKRYKVRLADSNRFDTVSYQATINVPAGEWREVRLPFSTFVPTWRGRTVKDAKPLDRRQIRRVGLMISDKQEGVFQLELAWICAYSEVQQGEAPGDR